ncbi:MAG: arabinose-proton symporter [Sphingobacteriales bacterium 50-39]|nr:sugar porter family MFS transporter [Sphingobacteriales bacterium]OJW57822.1 MAG: arabinose-proton symporter [Sphingobacteriales bacterium 50-39]
MNKSFVLRVSTVAAIGGLLFGYDTAVIAGVVGYLQARFHLSSVMVGWAASSAIWGCVIGAMLAGYLSDRMGRKKVLVITAILFFISSIAAALAGDLTQFILARLIGGLGIGAASMLSPLYISEIAPARNRGRLVSLYQLAIVLGINLIYFVNLRIAALGDEAWNVEWGWRYMLASGMLPAVLFLVLLFFVPESPRWLIARGRKEEALDILKKVNGEEVAPVVYNEIVDALRHETGTLKELFKPGLRMAMLVGAFLALFSQITGINAIIYYAPEIFKSAGFGAESAFMQTVIIGVVNTLFTFLAIWLIDKAGRRALLLWGVTGMIVCLLAVGLCYHYHFGGAWLLICILGYIASFACSLGPVPWVIISEIFPTKNRGVAMSFATVVLWVGVLLITQLTPVMLEKLGGAKTFLLFMVNAIVLLVFTWKRIPETRQRTLEDIEKSWTRH